MKTPSDRHPHGGLQRRLQAYDPRFWLVFLPRLKRWAVLYENPDMVICSPHLRGLEGCNGGRTHWEIGTIIWARDGRYLDPSSVADLVVSVVWKNDCRNSGSVLQRCKEIDRRQEEKKARAQQALREKVHDAARVACDTVGRGRVMSTSAGTVTYAS